MSQNVTNLDNINAEMERNRNIYWPRNWKALNGFRCYNGITADGASPSRQSYSAVRILIKTQCLYYVLV